MKYALKDAANMCLIYSRQLASQCPEDGASSRTCLSRHIIKQVRMPVNLSRFSRILSLTLLLQWSPLESSLLPSCRSARCYLLPTTGQNHNELETIEWVEALSGWSRPVLCDAKQNSVLPYFEQTSVKLGTWIYLHRNMCAILKIYI